MVGRPPKLRRVTALALALVLLAPTGLSVATATTGSQVVAHQDASSPETDVQFARTVEEMKGHLAMSVAYKRDNQTATAAMHAHHPYEEYWNAVGSEVNAQNATLAAELKAALEAAPDHARNDTASEYDAYIHDTLYPLLDQAKASVVTVDATNATFNAKVSAALLDRATQEYGEGVNTNGSVTEREQYDDARSFTLRAHALYVAHVRPTISGNAADALDERFANLHQRVAAAKPPKDVESAVSSIDAEYAEYTSMESSSSETQVGQTVDAIKDNLHEAVEAYEAGNVSKAKSIVRRTYLSYFESLEGGLIEKRPELVKDLESDFNEELPGLMTDNASTSDVQGKVVEMNGKLETVESVLATENKTTISLGNESDTTTDATTTTQAETSTATPGFGVAIALLAALGAALLALRRTTN